MEVIITEDVGRIDKYLKDVLALSRETVTKMINEEYILVNGRKIKPSYNVKAKDKVEIKEGFTKPIFLEKNDVDFEIVYEDKHLMVINKPSGLVVHPGNGNKNNTLVNGLLNYTSNLSDNGLRPGIVHRLDKDTSGLMLVAKSDEAGRVLQEDFKEKKVYREYIALLDGVFPQEKAIIDAPIGRDKTYFNRMMVRSDGKKAITHLEVIKRYKEYTLVKLVLDTGRTHQIRVHLSSIGYPVHNDPIYSNKKSDEFGQYLHSAFIRFTHPITKEVLSFSCEAPKTFKNFIKELEENK